VSTKKKSSRRWHGVEKGPPEKKKPEWDKRYHYWYRPYEKCLWGYFEFDLMRKKVAFSHRDFKIMFAYIDHLLHDVILEKWPDWKDAETSDVMMHGRRGRLTGIRFQPKNGGVEKHTPETLEFLKKNARRRTRDAYGRFVARGKIPQSKKLDDVVYVDPKEEKVHLV
jgi:hypothetical protein